MAIHSYNTVKDLLKQFSDNHLSVQRFDMSFLEELPNFSTDGEQTFPILYAEPIDVVLLNNIDEFSFRVYCVDLLQKDRTNETEILNQTLLVLRDLNNWLREDLNVPFQIIGDPTATPVNNFLMDYTTGWFIDITIETTPDTRDCSIPFTDDFSYNDIVGNQPTNSDTVVIDGLTTVILKDGETYTCSAPEEKLSFVHTIDTRIVDATPSNQYRMALSSLLFITIDWGDGTIENVEDLTTGYKIIEHTYATPGIYDVAIRGSMGLLRTIGGATPSDNLKIIGIKQWGDAGTRMSSMNGFFGGNVNCVSIPQNETHFLPTDSRGSFSSVPLTNFGKFITSQVNTLGGAFSYTNFDYNVGDWDMRRVVNLVNTFIGTSMSTANCDAILTGWTRWDSTTGTAGVTLQPNVSLHLGNTSFTPNSDAEDAFNYLVNTLNWVITFG